MFLFSNRKKSIGLIILGSSFAFSMLKVSKQVLTIVTCCAVTIITVLLLSFTTDKFTNIGYLGFGFL